MILISDLGQPAEILELRPKITKRPNLRSGKLEIINDSQIM